MTNLHQAALDVLTRENISLDGLSALSPIANLAGAMGSDSNR